MSTVRFLTTLSFLLLLVIGTRQQAAAQNVSRVEYYIDTDPGFGNGTVIPVTATADLSTSFQVPVNSLAKGFHTLYVRSYVAPYNTGADTLWKGGWSLTARRMFYKENFALNNSVVTNVSSGEYFVDADPGFGKGKAIAFTPASNVSPISYTFDVTSLSAGFHNLYVRFKNADGHWGHTARRTLYKEVIAVNSSTPANIVQGEYYIDTDPGFGKGKSIPVSPAADLSGISVVADVSAVSEGFHRIYARFKDANGFWGLTNTRTFYKTKVKEAVAARPNIVQVEYYIDADPGFGKGKAVAITEAVDLTNLLFEVDMTDVAIGNHRIYVRAKDANGAWSLTSSGAFKVEHPSGFYITIGSITGTICAGGAVSIPFTVNAPFSASNVFKAQLSNSSGSFASPVTIGTLAGNQSGTIQATIPAYTAAATGYRVRIIATAPEDTSAANGTALTVNRVPNKFSVTGDTIACFGPKTYTLSNPESGSDKYVWLLSGGGTLTANGTSASVNWTDAGEHTITVKYTGICAGDDSVKLLAVDVVNTPLTGTFERMLPEDGNPNLSLPLAFSWLPINGANSYDLYIWPENGTRPTTPTVANISGINHSINNSNLLQYEKTYKWQLVAKKACYTLESPVQTFKLRNLPDLVVTQVKVPPTAF
jgi:hypothetical protein